MLTNGWRRFNWTDVYTMEKKEKQYPIENGLVLNGEVRRAINNKPVPKNFEVNVKLKKDYVVLLADKARTNDLGKFKFNLPEFTDSAKLTIETKNRLSIQTDYLIDLQSNLERKSLNHLTFDKISSVPLSSIIPAQPDFHNERGSKTPTKNKEKRIDNYYFPGVDTFLIEEVEVKSDFLSQRDSLMHQTGEPDFVLESTQLKQLVEENPWYSDMWDLLENQIPGLKITRSPYMPDDKNFAWLLRTANLVIKDGEGDSDMEGDANEYIFFRVGENSNGRLLIAVDGTFLNGNSVPLFDFLNNMDPSDIESINFISKPKNYENSTFDANTNLSVDALAYEQVKTFDDFTTEINIVENASPDEFATGIKKLQSDFELMEILEKSLAPPSYLYITTKTGEGVFQTKTKGSATLYLNGFTNYKEFYSPKYENWDEINYQSPDFRKTIHWDPNIVTNKYGKANVSFYTGDLQNPISIMVQGLSKDGKTGVQFIQLNKNKPDSLIKEEKMIVENDMVIENIDYANLQLIGGIIVDADSKKPIISASITQVNPYYQVCCNMEGEFFIEKQHLHANETLIVTCPGYVQQPLLIDLANNDYLNIELKKAPLLLNVSYKRAKAIVRESNSKSRKYYGTEKVFQGYFRESVSVNSNTYGIFESQFNYTNKGYAANTSSLLFETEKFKNMEDKNGHRLLILKPNHRNRFYPLKTDILSFEPAFFNYDLLNEFEYELLGEVIFDNKLCYKIAFDQADDCISPYEKGIMYIEKESLALRSAQWEVSPKAQKFMSYSTYLQSNPLEYDLDLIGTYCEANYAFINGKLILQSTKDKLEFFVNNTDVLKFERELSVNKVSPKSLKYLTNSTWDTLNEEGKSKHMLVKDAKYVIKPWVRLGIIKPESYLIRDAGFMHDVFIYR